MTFNRDYSILADDNQVSGSMATMAVAQYAALSLLLACLTAAANLDTLPHQMIQGPFAYG